MSNVYYDPRIIEPLFLDGLSMVEIATTFDGNQGMIRYYINKLGLFLEKECVNCGKLFKTRIQTQKQCSHCSQFRWQKYYQIRNLRSDFHKVADRNLDLAEFLENWMLKEEGKEFTELAINGIVEKEKEKKEQKAKYKWLGDEYLESGDNGGEDGSKID